MAATRVPRSDGERTVPWVSAALTVLAVAIFVTPGAASLLQYDRTAIGRGELWRLLTGHWTHYNLDQLLWNALAFGFLGAVCERDDRPRFLVCLAAAVALVPLAVWTLAPRVIFYQGLSGLDSALFALLATAVIREKVAERAWAWVAAGGAVFLAFLGKVSYEVFTGGTVFVDSAAAGMVPLPLVHVVGAALGIAAAVVPTRAAGRPAGVRARDIACPGRGSELPSGI